MIIQNKTIYTICLFLLLTYIISFFTMGILIYKKDIMEYGLYGVLGGMWSPTISILILSFLGIISIHTISWNIGSIKYWIIGFIIPLIYTSIIYAIAYTKRYIHFTTSTFYENSIKHIYQIAKGSITGTLTAMGEEIGWSGLLTPLLYTMTKSYTITSFLRGIIWSSWHYPLIIGNIYGPKEISISYKILYFTISMVFFSFAFVWLQLQSKSLFPSVILHMSHNLCIQTIFPLFTKSNKTNIHQKIGEFGSITSVVSVGVAIFFWVLKNIL